MARVGYSPATRVFEAAGAGACLISDRWVGLEEFLEPGKEVLSAASGEEVAELIERLTEQQARSIGEAARKRVLHSHTYKHRVREVLQSLRAAS
jgi:spore maturation protein CgeB